MVINNFPKKMFEQLYKKMKIFDNVHEIIYISLINSSNVGDSLIYLAEKEFFSKKEINIKLEFKDSQIINKKSINKLPEIPIVVRGGGYFGDVWYESYKVLEYLVENYKDNMIIFMPQSIFFRDKSKLKKAKIIFDKHKKIIIFARDKISYKLAKKYFKYAKIYLSPDSAFFLTNKLKPSKKIYISKKFKKGGILYLNRSDKEKNFGLYSKNILSFDWIYLDLLSRIKYSPHRSIQRAIDLFNNKKLIIASRLHGAILASILGKPYILITNNYHKIESFYNSWLKDDINAHLARNRVELKRLIEHFS